MAARFRTHATETTSVTYAALMLQAAQDLEEVVFPNALPTASVEHHEGLTLPCARPHSLAF